jgi:hypothetical protein
MDPRETEDVVHRALRALPPPRAPHTLLPRVMAAVAHLRPGYGGQAPARPAPRTWFAWPLLWQAASIAALVLLSTGIVWVWPAAWNAVSAYSAMAWSCVAPRALNFVASASAVVTFASIVWNVFLQPVVGYVMVWIVLMSVACTAFGAALGRVALGGAPQS